MSNPSFSNIDLWLFELAEGNLSQAQVDKLELFLLQNPDLDVERDIWEMSKVSAAPIVYPNQADLAKKKPAKRYALIGLAALLLLTSAGTIAYFGADGSEASNDNNQLTASASTQNQMAAKEKQAMMREINELKSAVASLESKVAHTQSLEASYNSNTTTSGNNINNGNTTINGTASTEPTLEPVGINLVAVNFNPSVEPVGTGNGTGNGLIETFNANVEPLNNGSENVLAVNQDQNDGTDVETNGSEPALLAHTATDEDQIDVQGADYLPTSEGDAATTARLKTPWTGGIQSNYQNSLKNRMSRFGRNLQRMMDNPLALKNSRDAQLHIPGMSSLDINMGSVGTLITPRVQTLSRLQWLGEGNEQFMNQISVDGYSFAMRGGLGIQLNHSVYNHGGIQVGNAMFTYSPKISVNRKISIEPAVRFKMGNKILNNDNMGGVTQVEFDRGNVQEYYNGAEEPIGKSLWYKDLGLGLNVNTEWFFASAQFDNIFNHQDNIYSSDLSDPRRAGTQFVGSIGTDWENRNRTMGISPYLVYQKNENLSEAWLGANYHLNWFTMGAAVSSNLEPSASLGIKTNHFLLNINSDYTYSLMSDKKALSYQVTLRFLGKPNIFAKRLLNL